MRATTRAMICLCSLVLGACESTKNPFDPPKPIDQMNHDELCSYYKFFLTDPNLSQQTRQIATGKMRQKGCAS